MNKIIYLDAAASYQKSPDVIEAETDFLKNHYANAGRGFCQHVAYVDDMLVRSRARVAAFVNARPDQIVFTSGTTGAMNMVAGMLPFRATTRLAVSDLDHHSARLPFECRVKNRAGRVIVCDLDNELNFDLNQIPEADVFVITAMSNVLGRAQDVAQIIKCAKQKNPNVITVVDAAQYVVHEKIDVRAWDCDFMCFSAHKIGADTGLGILYVKDINAYTPSDVGGGAVKFVDADGNISMVDGPERYEAGTLPLTQIAGLIPAIDAIEQNRPDLNLIKFMYDELEKNPKIKMLSARDATLLTFVIDGAHPLDCAAQLGVRDICARVGVMCASWIMRRLNVDGAIRFSVGAYNRQQDVDEAIRVIKDIAK